MACPIQSRQICALVKVILNLDLTYDTDIFTDLSWGGTQTQAILTLLLNGNVGFLETDTTYTLVHLVGFE